VDDLQSASLQDENRKLKEEYEQKKAVHKNKMAPAVAMAAMPPQPAPTTATTTTTTQSLPSPTFSYAWSRPQGTRTMAPVRREESNEDRQLQQRSKEEQEEEDRLSEEREEEEEEEEDAEQLQLIAPGSLQPRRLFEDEDETYEEPAPSVRLGVKRRLEYDNSQLLDPEEYDELE
jgi:hypothetical protein